MDSNGYASHLHSNAHPPQMTNGEDKRGVEVPHGTAKKKSHNFCELNIMRVSIAHASGLTPDGLPVEVSSFMSRIEPNYSFYDFSLSYTFYDFCAFSQFS